MSRPEIQLASRLTRAQSFPRVKTMHSVSTPARNPVKSRLAVRMPSMQSPDSFFFFLIFRRSGKHLAGSATRTQGPQSPHGDRVKLRTEEVLSVILEMALVRIRHLSLLSQNLSGHIAISPRCFSSVVPNGGPRWVFQEVRLLP